MRRRRQRGLAMFVALALLGAAAIAGVAVARSMRATADAGQRERASLRTFHAAEAGVETARHALSADPSYRGETFDLGGTTVVVTVTHPTSESAVVVAEARDPAVAPGGLPARRRVEIRLDLSTPASRVTSWRELR